MRLLFWKKPKGEDGLPGRTGFWLAGIMAVAALLRMINIGKEPYWYDEVLSLDIVTSFTSASEMLRYLGRVEFHPPLYYLTLRPWIALFGTSEASVRSLSLIFSVGMIPLVYLLGKRIFSDRRVGLVAAAIVAVLPIQIEFGQEARPYALFCFAGCLAMLSVWEHMRSGRLSWVLAYIAATTVGLYLHYSYFFIMAATALWWLVAEIRSGGNRSRRLLVWLGGHAGVFVAFWPWLDEMLYKLLLGQFMILGLERNLVTYREPAFFGTLFDSVIWLTKERYIPAVQNLTVAFVVGLFIWIFIGVLREKRRNDELEAFATLTALALIPAALFFLSPYSIPYTDIMERHIVWVTVPIALLVAATAVRAGKRRGTLLIAVFVISLIPYVSGIVGDDSLFDGNHKIGEGAQYINEHYREGDVVTTSISIVRSDLSHYLRDDIPVESIIPINDRGRDVWRGRRTLGMIENELQVRIPKSTEEEIADKLQWIVDKHDAQRVWIYGLSQGDRKIHDWFDESVWRRSFRSIEGVFPLDLYTKR